MSQSTTSKRFPIQQVGELVSKVNDGIKEILSNSTALGFEGISILQSDSEKIIKLFFESVLEGEFVRNPDIEADLKNIRNTYISTSDEIENRLKDFSDENIKQILLNVIESIYLVAELSKKYIQFINQLNFLVNQDKDYIFSVSRNTKERIEREELDWFLVNLDLCVYDILLNESFKYATDIEYLKSIIKTDGYLSEQKEKMLKKANFLLLKWHKRAKISKKNVSSVVDGKIRGDYENVVIGYGDDWKNLIKYINNHYDNKSYGLKESFQNLIKDKSEKFDEYTCQDIHLYKPV